MPDCTEATRLSRIEIEQVRQNETVTERLETIDERTRETNIDIRLMAQSVAALADSVSKLGDMKERYHELDKRISNSEATLKYVKVVGVAITVALVGMGVAAVYGG